MRLSICGTDERSLCLKKIAEKKGYDLADQRPDAVVLPLPRSRLSDIKRMYPQGQKIICGKAEDGLKEAAKENGWDMRMVLEDESFLAQNACMTAEGAVYYAMKQKRRAFFHSECLVVGYGRIGRALHGLLRSMDARVQVAARREQARRDAGENGLKMEEIKDHIGRMDFVFNTVPATVLGEGELAFLAPDALLMELASPPYGVDMAAAARMQIPVLVEGGVPGRYCPMEAAGAWMDYIERSVLL